jgi:alkylation response protein AidB-like acyl-CoA dehydrogenase
LQRTLYEFEHDQFRDAFRAFLAAEVLPHMAQWEAAGIVPRELFVKAAASGFIAMPIPEDHGGSGVDDFRFSAVIAEEISHAGVSGSALGLATHNDICLPYFLKLATPEQRRRWLPGIASGALITAVGMTEPGAGSDLAGLTTRAVRDGDHYVVNGSKTFISNGLNADLVVTVARTGGGDARDSLSLLVIEDGMPGFRRGRGLEKIGQHALDTAELFFDDVRVPVENLLGTEGGAFRHLMDNLPQERLSIAVQALAAARTAVDQALAHVKERKAFGRPIGSFQNTRFVLAELTTAIDVSQSFLDDCVMAHDRGELSARDAASAKWWCTELQGRAVDRCLQLFGGYGYMVEYPIARAFADSRVTRIYGGTTEIMKEVVGRSLGL